MDQYGPAPSNKARHGASGAAGPVLVTMSADEIEDDKPCSVCDGACHDHDDFGTIFYCSACDGSGTAAGEAKVDREWDEGWTIRPSTSSTW